MPERVDQRVASLVEVAEPVAELSPGWEARVHGALASASRGLVAPKERTMRRLAYAVAFLVVIGLAAAGFFTRSRPPDGRSLLISAAQAMEAAQSVHMVGHGAESDPKSPSGMRMVAKPYETRESMSISDRRVERRGTTDGQTMVYGIDLDASTWWFYTSESGICYTADIRAVADQAAVVMRAMAKQAEERKSRWPIGDLDWLTHQHESTRVEARDGQEVAIVTITGTNSLTSRPLPERHVFELDAVTHHLLRWYRYVHPEGAPEQLLETVDRVEYDVPVPGIPKDAKRVTGTAKLETTEKLRSLQLFAPDGEMIVRSDQPR